MSGRILGAFDMLGDMNDRSKAQIRGASWVVYIDEFGEWDFEGDRSGWPIVETLNNHFKREDIEAHRRDTLYRGREYGDLFPMAAALLETRGIKCTVENLPQWPPDALPLPKD